MEIVHEGSALNEVLAPARLKGDPIGFVPTMGNLHDGHLALIGAAREGTHLRVVSIFVNPFQFGPDEDFQRYPRTLEADLDRLREAGTDVVFLPRVEELYPQGPENVTRVDVPVIAEILCGEFRPGFFRGVATVVCMLLNIVRPDVAYFGEKDYQQLLVVGRMVADLKVPVRIESVPTVRDGNGLALSSRNAYLSARERERAPRLYQTLCRARDALASGRESCQEVEHAAAQSLVADGFRVDYFTVRRASDLNPPTPGDLELVILAAVWLGRTRLIDNVRLRLALPVA